MADVTTRFALPLLAAGQAQKEVFHNEALARIDAMVHPVVQAIGLGEPPADAAPGDCWIVGATPAGAWTGQANALAVATEGGWRFVVPVAGMAVWLESDKLPARYDGTAWTTGDVSASRVLVGGQQVVGSRQPVIAEPTGGAIVDGPARTAISQVIATLRTHGLIA